MGIRMVREPGATPNINNIDDIIPFRYAYGNQDGYVINRGNELAYTINGNEFKINSGRVVVQGAESEIDANGATVIVDASNSTKQYYTIYYKVNLATNVVSIESKYDIAGYPTIDGGDDLTKTTSGYATLELYHFEAQSGVISNVEKLVKAIEYSGTALVGYDISKGTVEERLTRLGFREATITFYTESSSGGWLNCGSMRFTRQGNYVVAFNLGSIPFTAKIGNTKNYYTDKNLGVLPVEYRPKVNITIVGHGLVYGEFGNASTYQQIPYLIIFGTDGSITTKIETEYLGISSFTSYFDKYDQYPTQIGWEANPIL